METGWAANYRAGAHKLSVTDKRLRILCFVGLCSLLQLFNSATVSMKASIDSTQMNKWFVLKQAGNQICLPSSSLPSPGIKH